MKITKELLEHLKVISISLQHNKKNILCFLERIENNQWTFSISEKMIFAENQEVIFDLVFEREDNTSKLPATIQSHGENYLTVVIKNNDLDSRVNIFLKVLSEMEQKYEQFGRRKEERIKIGKEHYKELGLSKLEQTVFLQGIKTILPCVVLDASVHGICVIIPDTPLIKNEDIFCIKLKFENPEQTVVLKAHCVYSRLNKTEGKNFLTQSCQLLEPIHFVWKERVISMLNAI